jgi:hypothetical protein
MSHYTVQYLDQSRHHQSICEYAENSWEAKNQAIQDVPYLHSHPNSIDCILSEGSLFSSEI